MPDKPEPPAGMIPQTEDMNRLRLGIREHCKTFAGCDYESVNAVVTLKRTATEFENFVSAYFKQYDLSPGRFNVLMALFSSPNHTQTLSDLGDYLVVTRANITGLVDGLVEDGMLRRIDHPEDRRVILAQLTDKAVRFLNWFVPQHHKNIKALMDVFSSEEKAQLVGLLDKLRAHMQGLGPVKIVEPTGTESK